MAFAFGGVVFVFQQLRDLALEGYAGSWNGLYKNRLQGKGHMAEKIAVISVIRVGDLLLVTMPPDPGDSMLGALREKVLSAMEHHDARSVVLDVSSVETLDSFFVRTLSETARMVKLIGGRTIVAGIGPAVEETAARVGVSLENIETALSVDRALEHAATDAPARRF